MSDDNLKASARIIAKAVELGASKAGWARIEDLKQGPSPQLAPRMPYRRDEFENASHRVDAELKLKHGEVLWPESAKSVLVIALAHPEDKPEMDWWIGRTNPPGNMALIRIINQLCQWIEQEFGFSTFHLPYQVGKGGLYLKDAAVYAGIGCVGDNNMVVTPEYGPRVRLRALSVDADIPSTGPIAFYPCTACPRPCRTACPQRAMDETTYSPEDYDGLNRLPGRDGSYSVAKCDVQNDRDVKASKEERVEGHDTPQKILRFCRACEFSCPVGS